MHHREKQAMTEPRLLMLTSLALALWLPQESDAESLKVHGDSSPGGAIVFELSGPPGSPALLFLASGFLDPAVPTSAGLFHLDLTSFWLPISLGVIPGSGAISFPSVIPNDNNLIGSKIHLQGAAPDLSNAVSLGFHAASQSIAAAAPVSSDGFGAMLKEADFNGDGFEDVAVHTQRGNGGAGRVTVLMGPTMSVGLIIDDPTPQNMGRFGGAIDAGDLNADGIPDLVIGASGAGPAFANDTGEVVVVNGATGAVLQTYTSPVAAAGAGFGTDLALLDYDNDGLLDLAVGEPGATVSGQPLAGRVIVQSSSGFPVGLLTEPQPEAFSIFGGIVKSGDINLDGKDDLVIGAPAATVGGHMRAGEGFLFHSAATHAATYSPPTPTFAGAFACRVRIANVTGAANPDVIIGTPGGTGSVTGNPLGIPNVGEVEIYVDGDPNQLVFIDDPTPEFFQHFGMDVAIADVNGDGANDLLVGSFLADSPGQKDAGEVCVFLGPSFAMRFDITAPAPEAVAQFGVFVVGADVDGDGKDELVGSAPLSDVLANADAGRVYVIPFE